MQYLNFMVNPLSDLWSLMLVTIFVLIIVTVNSIKSEYYRKKLGDHNIHNILKSYYTDWGLDLRFVY